MTTKQKVIDLLDEYDMVDSSFSDDLLALIEHEQAEIERMNAAATDSNLLLERAQATNLEMLAAIERKDALLRQALDALLPEACGHTEETRQTRAVAAIKQELSQ